MYIVSNIHVMHFVHICMYTYNVHGHMVISYYCICTCVHVHVYYIPGMVSTVKCV